MLTSLLKIPMAVISIRVPEKFKKVVKATASFEGTSLQDFVINALKLKLDKADDYEYTTNDFNEETLEAIREMKENRHTKKHYSADELVAEMQQW